MPTSWFTYCPSIIFFTAFFVINQTQQKIEESYRDFGLMLTRTLATESIDLIKGLPTEEKQAKLEKYTQMMEQVKERLAGLTK